jgi:uncharacterized protein (DUF305 family)
MSHRKVVAPLAAVLAAVAVGACGDDNGHEGHTGTQLRPQGVHAGSTTDRGFLNQMVPHHQDAVDMAAIAAKRAEHPEIKELAASISKSQTAEIQLMNKLKKQEPTGGESAMIDKSMHTMGMDEIDELKTAEPFDRAFIDAMVPHHHSAVHMANMELSEGKNSDVRALARRIIDAQEHEIAEMKRWRQDWYGGSATDSGDHHMSE